jgi:tetratricopeptide (TPR) repeat protein
MTPDAAKSLLRSLSLDDTRGLFNAGLDLLDADLPELLIDTAAAAARRHPRDVRILQLLGLTSRAIGQSSLALDAFARAAALAPADPLLAHSHARAALEAGHAATALFEKAVRLAPADGSVHQGRAAAQLAEGNAGRAIADLEALVRENPLWIDGHRTLARLRGQEGEDPAAALDRALARLPRQADLHREKINIRLEARDLEGADVALRTALESIGAPVWLKETAAHIASERGDLARADELFTELGAPQSVELAAQRARHLVRANRPDVADSLIDHWAMRDPGRLLWPYRSLAWRMLDDPRWRWLDDQPSLVRSVDIAEAVGDIGQLANYLRELHNSRAAPLDQSVRGGTQTDGNLLLRDAPAIARLREAIMAAVEAYIGQLPPADANHPALPKARGPIRIAGSWSVRLVDEGFHADHVHPQGWISSAFYVAVPDTTAEGQARRDGWLSLGEARDLVPGLAPLQMVQPKPGRLVLFPSTMWHGTRPFPAGERMTVAFDIMRPRQG